MLGVGQVISGIDETLPKMSQGQRVKIEVPPRMAYGSAGYPPSMHHSTYHVSYVNEILFCSVIPPDTPLTFELELVHLSHLSIYPLNLVIRSRSPRLAVRKGFNCGSLHIPPHILTTPVETQHLSAQTGVTFCMRTMFDFR